MKLADFVTMVVVVAKGHTLAPEAARRLVVGFRLAARPVIQYESSITAQVGGSNFSASDNAKYVKICLVVY
jgi:hypothetical protein